MATICSVQQHSLTTLNAGFYESVWKARNESPSYDARPGCHDKFNTDPRWHRDHCFPPLHPFHSTFVIVLHTSLCLGQSSTWHFFLFPMIIGQKTIAPKARPEALTRNTCRFRAPFRKISSLKLATHGFQISPSQFTLPTPQLRSLSPMTFRAASR